MQEIKRVLFVNDEPITTSVQQVLVPLPTDWLWNGKYSSCGVSSYAVSETAVNMDLSRMSPTRCNATVMSNELYLLVDANTPSALNTSHFSIHLVNLTSPRGVLSPLAPPKPLHFITKLPNFEFRVFSTVLLVEASQTGILSQGVFAPQNVLSQAVDNATLRFTTSVPLAAGTFLRVNFSLSGFNFIDSQWFLLNGTTTVSIPTVSYDDKSKVWILTLPNAITALSAVELKVTRARNPEAAFKDTFAAINVDAFVLPSDQPPTSVLVVAQGAVTATLVRDFTVSPPSSPYNWISLVLLLLSLLFCLLMLYKHGLFLHPSHPIALFSDLTAIASVLGLFLGVVNNALWIAGVNVFVFFYIKCGVSSVAFTMLLSVCAHWGAVLSRRIRKLPIFVIVSAFVALNALFYTFQLVVGALHHDVVKLVYTAEQSVNMLDPIYPCKNGPTFQFVFSDIQPFYTKCYIAHLDLSDVHFFTWFSNTTYSIFALLTCAILALGYMVMRRGSKILHLISYSPQQIYLMKALRLYTALIALVTLTYLVAFSMQFVQVELPYYWWYLTTVWLPQCIPPCSFIFLQWNSATKSLRKETSSQNNSTGENTAKKTSISTPRITTMDPNFVQTKASGNPQHLPSTESSRPGAPTYDGVARMSIAEQQPAVSRIGLSLRLTIPEAIPHGCYVAMELQCPDNSKWTRVGTTDTADTVPSSDATSYVVPFLAVLSVSMASPATSSVRFLVFAAPGALSSRSSDSKAPSSNDGSMLNDQNGIVDGLEYLDGDCSDSDCDADGDDDPLMQLLLPTDRCVASFHAPDFFDSAMDVDAMVLAADHSRFQLNGLCRLEVKFVHDIGRRSLCPIPSDAVVTSQYHLHDQQVLVVEELSESPYANSIPGQYLDIIIARRTKAYYQAEYELDQFLAMEHARMHQDAAGMGTLYENLLEQIQGEADRRQCREWLQARVDERKAYLCHLRQCRMATWARERTTLSGPCRFKPSTAKRVADLACIPVNLHLHEMHVVRTTSTSSTRPRSSSADGTTTYSTTTVGAFAAHLYEFKQGGVFSLSQEANKCTALPDADAETSLFPTTWQYLSQVERRRCDLEWTIHTRLDVCVPQALATLATSFTATIQRLVDHPLEFERLLTVGFIFHVESLLSTYGAELGMLEDMMEAMQTLGRCRILLVPDSAVAAVGRPSCSSSTNRSRDGDLDKRVVTSVDLYTNVDDAIVGMRTHDHAKSDEEDFILRVVVRSRGKVLFPKRCLVPIHPLLFNIGIDEKQSLANMSLAVYPKKLQDHINDTALQRLKSIVATYCELVPHDAVVPRLLQNLVDAVHASTAGRKKHPAVLQLSSRLCHIRAPVPTHQLDCLRDLRIVRVALRSHRHHAVGCTLYGPIVLKQVLSALESESFNMKAVLVSIASLFLVKVAQALITAHSTFQNQLVTVQITSALQHLLFRKSLVLDSKCRREKAAGDIANMFSTQTIINFSIFANQLWLIQVTIVLYACCTT
ncbi:hypothetical protein DYB32_006155 [Aphanomyces invadans]|uniref:Uncharacterized protein n=1 Tax=Aphanomyces invadans TaxID=157072 RepID=A0A3R7CYI9_9STRA|nr:hypothetical protein DYB32_006155 [Aphanomyces invadans]